MPRGHVGPMGHYVATLACRSRLNGKPHTLTFKSSPPMVGETLWCTRCADWSRVTDAPYMWRGVCRSCTWKSEPQVRKTPPMEAVLRHVRTHPAHTVQLRKGRGVYDTWIPSGAKTLEEKLKSLLTGL